MPKAGSRNTWVLAGNQILISSSSFRLINYYIDCDTYSFVRLENFKFDTRSIACSNERLYLFEGKKIFEMNMQYEVLDTITRNGITTCFQRFTNKEGIIFLLEFRSSKVFHFNPFAFGLMKKPMEVVDLRQDYNFR